MIPKGSLVLLFGRVLGRDHGFVLVFARCVYPGRGVVIGLGLGIGPSLLS